MGFIVLPEQNKRIQQLLTEPYDSFDLLWLPGLIRVTVWLNTGEPKIYDINEDGEIL